MPKQLAEHVVEEVPKDFLFLMGIDRAGGNDLSPLLQLRDTLGSLPRQVESEDGKSNDIRAKDRLGFYRHGEKPSSSLGVD